MARTRRRLETACGEQKDRAQPRTRDRPVVHLLAAWLQRPRTVIPQRQVDSKRNEISALRPLLEPVDLTGKVVTSDALLTQHDHAGVLVEEKNAHCTALIKGNHPTLHSRHEIPLMDGSSSTPPGTSLAMGSATTRSSDTAWGGRGRRPRSQRRDPGRPPG